MRLLAIDTALAACSAAIFDSDSGVIASESLPMPRGHAEALLPLIERVVAASEIDYAALDRIVVTVGPGSFTGLRVGVSAARGVALAANKPCVGVTTLHALAAPCSADDSGVTALAVIDARHQHVYSQAFGAASHPLARAKVISIGDAIETLPFGRVHIVGNAAALIQAAWPEDLPQPGFTQRDAPDITWVARLGAQTEVSATPPKPFYLKAPDVKPPPPSGLIRL